MPPTREQAVEILKQQAAKTRPSKTPPPPAPHVSNKMPEIVPFKKRLLNNHCNESQQELQSNYSNSIVSRDVTSSDTPANIIVKEEKPSVFSMRPKTPEFALPLPDDIMDNSSSRDSHSTSSSVAQSPKLVIDETPAEKSIIENNAIIADKIDQHDSRYDEDVKKSLTSDDFDHVLNELRQMNEMCENTSSSCSPLSRY